MMLDLNCFAGRDCPAKSAQPHPVISDIERVCQVLWVPPLGLVVHTRIGRTAFVRFRSRLPFLNRAT